MKNWWHSVVAYLQDNPEGYWFKAKLYGYGWTPATREGWFVTILAIALIAGNAIRFEQGGYPEEAVFRQVLIPTSVVIVLLILICIRTGEPPRWQFGPSKRRRNADRRYND